MIKLCEGCQTNHFPMDDYWFEDKTGKWKKYLCQRCVDQIKVKKIIIKEEFIHVIEEQTMFKKLFKWLRK